jgi:uncharacterized protein
MNTFAVDPLHLDVQAFAQAQGQLESHWPLSQLERLGTSLENTVLPHDLGNVSCTVQGEHQATARGEAKVWLHLKVSARVPLQCQRCLQAVWVELNTERSFLFVQGEDAATQLDAEHEHDVLALTRSLNLRELVEDELLLALPLVPLHDQCTPPAPLQAVNPSFEERPNPFAALAALKRPDILN